MSPPLPRHQAALQSAVQRIKYAARDAAQRCVDALGLAALSSLKVRQRDDLLAAQFALNRKHASFALAFNKTLDQQLERELEPPRQPSRETPGERWEALTLVDDHEVEATISADRFGLAIQHACEWELREFDAYVGSLLQIGRPDHDRNPLRPELVGKALFVGVEAVTEEPEIRKLLGLELGRVLADAMPKVYAEIVADLRDSGLQPVSLSVRGVEGPGNDLGVNTSGYDSMSHPLDAEEAAVGPEQPPYGSGYGPAYPTGTHHDSARWQSVPPPSNRGRMPPPARAGARTPSGYAPMGGPRGGGAPIGHVDPELMTLMRRIASMGFVDPGAQAGAPLAHSGFRNTGGAMPAPQNLIYAHRDQLRQASTGTLDHMVIDVVGSLFEQILSDPKVPPQMARQISRLQLPVLRVALGDPTFFSSRRHPVRRFVNRIASLACAFDDLDSGEGRHFLGQVRELVEDIVGGDFDQMDVYEQKLATLEGFITRQAQQEVQQPGNDAPALLEGKEHDLRIQQRYMRLLQEALAGIEMPDFLREFLTQVWSQALVQAAHLGGETGEPALRLKRAGREVVISVQPKGTPTDRKNFLLQLPQLMKDLNHGLALIGWSEAAKKAFFAKLLPTHAESLKGQSLRQLDYNLLVKQLDAAFATALPQTGDVLTFEPSQPVVSEVLDHVQFSPEEAEKIGFVQESAVNWERQVDIDIDLSAEPDISAVDINLEGLPPPEPVEPTHGASLADHVQLGFAYQMHIEDRWQKVKLNYVSPGRAFFVFTRGKTQQKTISFTARMLRRLCETGRLRAFENAFLLERATARARKQLAALQPGAAPRR